MSSVDEEGPSIHGPMSNRNFERGVRDGRQGTYNPPHEDGLLGGLLFLNSKAEIEGQNDYDRGYRSGRKDVKTFKAKVFKSGNSLALRLPAGLGLTVGMEMELRADGREHFSFRPVERCKRKFNVEKVWGSATGLELIRPEDRLFTERPLLWDAPDSDGPGTASE